MLNISKLTEIQPAINLRYICTEAGLSYASIYAKMRRGTQLNVDESQALEEALKKKGLMLYKEHSGLEDRFYK
jgi:hypothetical protein